MKQPAAKPHTRQPWCPGHWINKSGLGMDPTDLREGTDPLADDGQLARQRIVAATETDQIIRRMMRK